MKLFLRLGNPSRQLQFATLLVLILQVFFSAKIIAQGQPEFRGVWVSTLENMDWPGQTNFNSDSQKAAFIQLLDMHQRNGLNAVIVQVRPSADAFYPSPYEPWSQWLTGIQGQPPAPYYDPLAFMIAEAHKRGMAFHAWINPYRAVFNIDSSSVSANHITKLHAEWFLTYGNKLYFDPGNKEAQQYVTRIVSDIVTRYSVDPIQFDDYFYPYRIAGIDFPDDVTFKQYGKGMKRADWRRSNTDSIISILSRAIKQAKKKCEFGISPFGVWRNQDMDALNGSRTNGALSNYDDLYADILLWLKKGWLDYVAPQLYWELGHRIAPFEVLTDWWSKHLYGKHCYIGIAIYRANSNAAWKNLNQLPRQVQNVRNTPNIKGMIFFRSKFFENNTNGWNDSLRLNYFKDPAKVPEMDWLK
jgi:uncharacterized lipoprotein YddW (UPF0748 family)